MSPFRGVGLDSDLAAEFVSCGGRPSGGMDISEFSGEVGQLIEKAE